MKSSSNIQFSSILSLVDWPQFSQKISSRFKISESKTQFLRPHLFSKYEKAEKHINGIELVYEQIDKVKEIQGNLSAINLHEGKFSLKEVPDFLELEHFEFLFRLTHSFEEISRVFPWILDCVGVSNRNSELKKELSEKFTAAVGKIWDGNNFNLDRDPIIFRYTTEKKQIDESLRKKADKYCKHYESADFSPYYDLVNEKFAIATRSDKYHQKMGRIIGHSKKGYIIFLEPDSFQEDNEKRIECIRQIQERIYSFLRELNLLFRDNKKQFVFLFNDLLKVDIFLGCSLFSYESDYCRPQLSEAGEIKLSEFKHPLIDNPVKNSVSISSDKTVFIISGPNAGGKSVALKSIFLCNLLFKMGLPVPASSATLPWQNKLFYISSDMQNLEEGLSSFTSESSMVLKILNQIDENSSIFIDEIFSSTNSRDASIIAIAVFKYIQKYPGIRLFTTTHHDELKFNTSIFSYILHAHMEFSQKDNQPTYLLNIGNPGLSHGLPIFRNLLKNFPKLSQLTPSLESEAGDLIDLEKKFLELENEKEEFLETKVKLQQEIDKLEKEKKEISDSYKLQMENEFGHYKKNLEKELLKAKKLSEKLLKGDKKRAELEIHELNKKIRKQDSSDEEFKLPQLEPSDIKIGIRAFSKKFNKTCEILNIKKSQAYLQVGTFKTWVDFSDLHHTQKQQTKASPKNTQVHIINMTESNDLEVDFRGVRLDDFEREAEREVYSVLNGTVPFKIIIHGHGDGILKKWLRNFLKQFKELTWENIEGNDGATKIYLNTN